MFAVSTTAGGVCIGAPDVCTTMPKLEQIGFVNQAHCRNAVIVSEAVFIENKPALLLGSIVPFSTGAAPNAISGVVSGVVNHVAFYRTGSEKVYADGQRVALHMAIVGQNGVHANCVGCQVTRSQGLVFAAS